MVVVVVEEDSNNDGSVIAQLSRKGVMQRMNLTIPGVCWGTICIVAGMVLLFSNQYKIVHSHKMMENLRKSVISLVDSNTIDPENEGKLVHLTGMASASVDDSSSGGVDNNGGGSVLVRDDTFGVTAEHTLRLERNVEMYLWQETRTEQDQANRDDFTTTVAEFTYSQEWSSHDIDSSTFNDSVDHPNPPMSYQTEYFVPDTISIGAFRLAGSAAVNKLDWFLPLPETSFSLDGILPETRGDHSTVSLYEGHGYYFGRDPSEPQIGDFRVTYSAVPEGTISIVAKQVNGELTAYTTNTTTFVGLDSSILLVEPGSVSAKSMFSQIEKNAFSTTTTWTIRIASFLVIWFGMLKFAHPMAIAIGPHCTFCRRNVHATTTIGYGATCLCTVMIQLIVIALSWIVVTPILMVPAAIAAGGLYCLAWKILLMKKYNVTSDFIIPNLYVKARVADYDNDGDDLELSHSSGLFKDVVDEKVDGLRS